jgi:hypothetical protein
MNRRPLSKMQLAFVAWCNRTRVRSPATDEEVGCYLCTKVSMTSPASAELHLAAIRALYRAQGYGLDVRSEWIQAGLYLCRGVARYRREQAAREEQHSPGSC